MLPGRKSSLALLVVLALVPAVAGCGGEDEQTADKTAQETPEGSHREGLFVEIGELGYNVYITRELNLRDVEDKAYYQGSEAPPGSAHYGVFIRVCNETDEPHAAAADFRIRDTQGGEYEPVELSEDNVFAYVPGEVPAKACIPRDGSAAANGPTGGALLLFELPNEATENRPLELEIRGPQGEAAEQPQGSIELDI